MVDHDGHKSEVYFATPLHNTMKCASQKDKKCYDANLSNAKIHILHENWGQEFYKAYYVLCGTKIHGDTACNNLGILCVSSCAYCSKIIIYHFYCTHGQYAGGFILTASVIAPVSNSTSTS